MNSSTVLPYRFETITLAFTPARDLKMHIFIQAVAIRNVICSEPISPMTFAINSDSSEVLSD